MNSKDTKTKVPPTKEELQKIKEIFDSLDKDPQAYDFLEPVDFAGLGLDDYPQIVKNPMDVSTIRKNIKNNKYNSLQEILNDIQLIWDNCKLYNMEGSEIYKMAIHCEKVVKRLTDKHFKPAQNTATKSKKPTNEKTDSARDDDDDLEESEKDVLNLQEKIQITEKIRKMSNEGLAALVRLIQKECSVALEDLDNEKLQIRVDSLDRKTFESINLLIEQFAKIKEATLESSTKKLNIKYN